MPASCAHRRVRGLVLAAAFCASTGAVFFETADAAEIRKFEGHPEGCWGVAISPDGRRGASVGDNRLVRRSNGSAYTESMLRIWGMEDQQKPLSIKLGEGQLYAVAFSPDSSRIAVGGQSDLVLVQARDGKILHRFGGFEGWTESLAFSRDGSQLVSAGLRELQFWEVRGGRLLRSTTHGMDTATTLALTRDSRLLCAGGYASNTKTKNRYLVRLWDVGRRARDFQMHFPERTVVRTAVLTADERHVIVLGGDGKIGEWDVASEELRREWPGVIGYNCLAISADGRYVATGRSIPTERSGVVVELWDASDARVIDARTIPGEHLSRISVSRDGRHALVSTVSGAVLCCELTPRQAGSLTP